MLAAKRDDLLEEFAPYIITDDPWTACVAITEPAGGANLEDPAFEFRTVRTIAKLKEEGKAPELVTVATSPVGREFREINRWTEVRARWGDEGVERVTKLLEEVRINGTTLEF